MAQAKGILAKRQEETTALYRNPRTCGYFIGVRLRGDLDRATAQQWFQTVSPYVDELVERLPPQPGQVKGDKVAAVAVGLSPGFFVKGGQPRFDPPIPVPAGFEPGTPESPNPLPFDVPALAGIPRDDADVMFYVASVFEARVSGFIEQLQATAPIVDSISLARGFQRVDGTEPFGYQDGVRNMPSGVRSLKVFVHSDTEPEEPKWAEGGSYMANMRIAQNLGAFQELADDGARDNVFGRQRDGTRLDLAGQGISPKEEAAEPAPALPSSSHVTKSGPRGRHDDTQIFRRGLPFMDVAEGRVHVGLNFASFQASLDTFDTVLNDWVLNPHFPMEGAGPDALFDPSLGLTTIERVGVWFVPPYDQEGLAAAVFAARERPQREGRLVVRKRVIDRTDPSRRFERAGFVFRILDAGGTQVGEQFVTNSSGRAVFDGFLTIGSSYTLDEIASPFASVVLKQVPLVMERRNQQLRIVNEVTQPNTPYGG